MKKIPNTTRARRLGTLKNIVGLKLIGVFCSIRENISGITFRLVKAHNEKLPIIYANIRV